MEEEPQLAKKKRKGLNVGQAVKSLKTIPDGKVVDFISGKLLKDTPEEYVRQNVAMSLVLEYGYEKGQIEIEYKIKAGSGTKWIDIAVFPEDKPHDQEHIAIIVGLKRGQATFWY